VNKAMITCITAAGIIVGALAYVGTAAHGRVSAGASPSGTFTGYVTDLKCNRAVDAECNRQCLRAGEQPALLLDGSNQVVRLTNAEQAKKYPGAHVQVKGTRSEDVIVVATIEAH
jgi:hypothetical protein